MKGAVGEQKGTVNGVALVFNLQVKNLWASFIPRHKK